MSRIFATFATIIWKVQPYPGGGDPVFAARSMLFDRGVFKLRPVK